MKITDRRQMRRLCAAALLLGGMFAVCGFSNGRMVCVAKETGTAAKQEKEATAVTVQKKEPADDVEQEIVEFVTSYHKANSPEGIDTLADYVDDPESRSFQIDLLRLRETLKCGVKGWENIKVLVRPMSDGKHWVVSASGDMIVEKFDVGIPGLREMLVGRNKEGALKISSYAYDSETDSDAFIKEMREISLSDEFVEHSNEVAAAYNDLVAERADIMEWLLETREEVDQAVGEILVREEALSEKADSEAEKPDMKKGSYTVKKGDCLWDIAEEQLGDGMRWSSLYEQNKDVVGENPDLLYVGITLQLD